MALIERTGVPEYRCTNPVYDHESQTDADIFGRNTPGKLRGAWQAVIAGNKHPHKSSLENRGTGGFMGTHIKIVAASSPKVWGKLQAHADEWAGEAAQIVETCALHGGSDYFVEPHLEKGEWCAYYYCIDEFRRLHRKMECVEIKISTGTGEAVFGRAQCSKQSGWYVRDTKGHLALRIGIRTVTIDPDQRIPLARGSVGRR